MSSESFKKCIQTSDRNYRLTVLLKIDLRLRDFFPVPEESPLREYDEVPPVHGHEHVLQVLLQLQHRTLSVLLALEKDLRVIVKEMLLRNCPLFIKSHVNMDKMFQEKLDDF